MTNSKSTKFNHKIPSGLTVIEVWSVSNINKVPKSVLSTKTSAGLKNNCHFKCIVFKYKQLQPKNVHRSKSKLVQYLLMNVSVSIAFYSKRTWISVDTVKRFPVAAFPRGTTPASGKQKFDNQINDSWLCYHFYTNTFGGMPFWSTLNVHFECSKISSADI